MRPVPAVIACLVLGRVALAQESAAPPADGATVMVRGAARPLVPSRQTLSGEQAARGAGTQGDPVKVLQTLPGLGRGGPGSDLVAWGSEPRESRIEIDGVEVPRLYHGSGVRSIVLPSLIESISATPGAFRVDHGRATGGLVELRTRPLPTTFTRLGGSVDTLDMSAFAAAPLVNGSAAGLAAARYGYADRWLRALIDPRVRGLYEVPSYWDGSAAVELALPGGRQARLVGLTSSDRESFEVDAQDASRARRSERRLRFGRVYLSYRSRSPRTGELELTPFIGWDEARQNTLSAGRTSQLGVSSLVYGLRAEHRSSVLPGWNLTLGLDAAGTSARVTRVGSLSVPRREGDPYPFDTPPGYGTARDEFRAHLLGVGAYAELELHSARFSLAPALRVEPTLVEASRARPPLGGLPDIGTSRVELGLEPRLFTEVRLSRKVRIFASCGVYHQPPAPTDLSARFGNPQLGLSRATELAAGENAQLAARTRVELVVFAKRLSGLAVRSPDPQPRLAEALLPNGQGRAYGTQLFLRQGEVHGFSGWLSVTLSRSERRAPGEAYRLSDYDSPLVAALVLEKALGVYRLATRARYASGSPRTPVVGAFYDTASNTYQPELGGLNTARFRDFIQLDLRFDRTFTLAEDTRLELYLDLLNVSFRRNQEQLIYASDFRTFGSVSGLPPLVILGLTVER
jgi:hypothetical protein